MSTSRDEIINNVFGTNIAAYERVKEFEERRKLNLFQKLIDDDNEINSYSWQTEVQFGLYFDKFCEKLVFDTTIEKGIKPDWLLVNNAQQIIAEVKRINTNEENLLKKLEWYKFVKRHDAENPESKIVAWTGSYSGSGQYFFKQQRKITDKEIIYGTFASREKLPFLICVQSTQEVPLGHIEATDFFHAGKFGIFQTNDNMHRNVTGILFRDYWGEVRYYPNDLSEHKLNEANQRIFASIQ